MRVKIIVDTKNDIIPFEYHGFLQGAIYKSLTVSGEFIHDHGVGEERTYKMFTFSELSGKYEVADGGIVFLQPCCFYVTSIYATVLNEVFSYYTENKKILLGKNEYEVLDVIPINDECQTNESKEYTIRTLSPITCYKTDEKRYRTYFNPKSQDFEDSLLNNLIHKAEALNEDVSDEYFSIDKVLKEKVIKIKFKNNVYTAYYCTLRITVSDYFLWLLMHTGLGSKNSAGFGMVEIL